MLEVYNDRIRYAEVLVERRRQCEVLLDIPYWDDYREMRRRFFELPFSPYLSVGDVVSAGSDIDADALSPLLRRLHPWRKGPFRLGSTVVDAEWRADRKWARLGPHLPSLQGKRVVDIGCNNGYYLFRLFEHNPELLLGFDPNARFFLQFDLVHRCAGSPPIGFELLGVEHLELFPEFFDVLLCMGVLSHRRDPQEALRSLYHSTAPQGTLLLENLTVSGARGEVLVPHERYAKMRNVWAIPTPDTLCDWARIAGYREAEILSTVRTRGDEQRSTPFMTFESLEDFLDPEDSSKTVEGYPAPERTLIRCKR